jgi:Tfp pilus assembly protein PilF
VLFVLFLSACATAPSTENINQSEAHNKMGYSYFSNGLLNEAYAEFQKAIMLNPKNKEALNQLGYISAVFKNYDEAVSYYKRAISVDPAYSEAMNNLGVIYLEMQNWDEAVKYFKDALKNPLYRSPEKAYSNMGYAYYRKGEYLMAEKCLKDALIRNPLFPIANYTLGLVYVKRSNDNEAIEEFKKAIGIMPNYMDAHWELAHAYLRTGEKDMALEHFRIIARKDSDIHRSREALEYLDLLK